MIPTIDPQVKHVGVSYLRKLNADSLRSLEGALVICENSQPLAVVVTYEMFLRIQQATTINPILPPYKKDDILNARNGRGKVTRETRGGKR